MENSHLPHCLCSLHAWLRQVECISHPKNTQWACWFPKHFYNVSRQTKHIQILKKSIIFSKGPDSAIFTHMEYDYFYRVVPYSMNYPSKVNAECVFRKYNCYKAIRVSVPSQKSTGAEIWTDLCFLH